ncbi:hypothetical protein ACFL56_03785 [Candidatus Margulisiibacteriota bacterium]
MFDQIFQPDLLSDERLLWTGQPDPSKLFTKGDIFMIPFSLMWGGFAIFWETMALSFTVFSDAPDPVAYIFPLFGLPFVIVGCYMIFGRFLLKKYKKKRTYYAVTNKRVIVLTQGRNKNIKAEFLDKITSINKSTSSSGTGNIYFGGSNFMTTMYGNTGMDFFASAYTKGTLAFYDIPNVDSVYSIINNAR